MEIANIYPIKNQKHYKREKFVMILAHLVKAKAYNPRNFSKKQYIIMDNGLFEKAQVSTRLIDCIMLAEQSGIPIKEIIIPDVVNDPSANEKLFLENLDTIKKWHRKYTFMFVAQANNEKELARAARFINLYDDLNLVVGISKLTPMNRGSVEACAIYERFNYPVHFLGIKETFRELCMAHRHIRSCDTSQVAFIAKNSIEIDTLDMFRYVRRGQDIDLAKDKCSNHKIRQLLRKERKDLKEYGIL